MCHGLGLSGPQITPTDIDVRVRLFAVKDALNCKSTSTQLVVYRFWPVGAVCGLQGALFAQYVAVFGL